MLQTDFQKYIHLSRYARWREDLGRRESWEETVARYFDFFDKHLSENFPHALKKYQKTRPELERAVLNLEVVPSMRCLMTAGPALERDHVAGYNCSYVAVDDPRVFSEVMYVLLCGTGVGFSVERQYINDLPTLPEELHPSDTVIAVADSKIGWASAYRELIGLLYAGKVPKWDLSKIRPAGARLKTFGGRASGPAPLDDLFKFTIETFRAAEGRKLNSLEVHDIICKVGDVVVVGGVRRSALISLSNLTDERMRHAKSGEWWKESPQRALANNSVAYTEKPDAEIFLKEWLALVQSKSGERGIFSRCAAQGVAARSGRRDATPDFGTNPCSEIILRSKQFCNLSEVVVRPGDGLVELERKVRLATILGTLQSSLTTFRFLSSAWKKNTEEERLLGVSLTGIMDHGSLGSIWQYYSEDGGELDIKLKGLQAQAVVANMEWAKILDIPESTAITCVKPSGTVSQLVDAASGIHPRYAPFYIRTVRADARDPLAQFMVKAGFPCEPDVTKPDTTLVFSFPQKAPENAITRNDLTAIQQLELWKVYQDNWCEHKPSITVYVGEDEWLEVGAWVYKHFDALSGVSFLPREKHSYRQAPYQEITEADYELFVSRMPAVVDWSGLVEYEKEDNTTGSQELACTGGVCDV